MVSDKELYDINETGAFRAAPGQVDAKYFFNTLEQAIDLGNRMLGEGNYGLVLGEFPCSTPVDEISPATEGPGFVVQGKHLPTGVPTILWP